MKTLTALTVLATSVISPAAFAHGGDVGLKIANNKIGTGLVDDSGPSEFVVLGERVFAGEIGLSIPGFGDEPGLFAEENAFSAGAGVSFNVRKALRRWNGSDFLTGPSAEQLKLESPDGLLSIDTPLADPSSPLVSPWGFAFPSSGAFDDHPNFYVLNRIEAGTYLLELEITTTQAGIAKSDPIWLVINDGGDELEHDAAIEWTEENLVPAPGSLAILGAFGVLASRRRRS